MAGVSGNHSLEYSKSVEDVGADLRDSLHEIEVQTVQNSDKSILAHDDTFQLIKLFETYLSRELTLACVLKISKRLIIFTLQDKT